MSTARDEPTATLLQDGRVLIAGGAQEPGDIKSAELYDPVTGEFTATGDMRESHGGLTTALLSDGRVLFAGGSGDTSAELYDPATGKFSLTGSMTTARGPGARAILLPNGLVLVVGGDPGTVYSGVASSAELYDPTTGKFSPTGPMTVTEVVDNATLLSDGSVLVTGGSIETSSGDYYESAEVYDPASGKFQATGTTAEERTGATATLLKDGRVLIAGGWYDDPVGPAWTAEVYDPATGIFSPTGDMEEPRAGHAATLLQNGRVLIAGGSEDDVCDPDFCWDLDSAELYDPSTGLFVPAGSMSTPRTGDTATLLSDGQVLVVGGSFSDGPPPGPTKYLSSAELYQP